MGSYWGAYLSPNPPPNVPAFPKAQNIRSIGWIPQRTQNVKDPERNTLDTAMVASLRGRGLSFDEDAYSLVQPTYRGCHNAMLRYDQPRIELPEEPTRHAQERLLAFFKPYAATCPLCPEEKMEWNRKASAGHYFKTVYGCKFTGDILDVPHLMDEMRGFAREPEYPTLWTVSVKEELLPIAKIRDEVPRTITAPDKRQHYLMQELLQTQHELFIRLGSSLGTFLLCGSSMFYGGFTRIMDLFSQYQYKFAGDISKFDSCQRMEHFVAFCIPVHELLYEPQGFTNRERAYDKAIFSEKLYDSYLDMAYSYVLLPTGEVLLLPGGMNSGDKRTTDDNTLVHGGVTFALEFMVKKTYHVECEALWRLYSDDHGAATQCVELTDFAFRKTLYAMYGFALKESDDFVSESVEGMTLLGFKCKWSPYRGRFVPLANVERLCCMLCRPKRRIDPIMQFARVNACRILTYFNPEGPIFKKLVDDTWHDGIRASEVYEPGSQQQLEYESLCQPWTDSEVEALWLGFECRGEGLKDRSVQNDINQVSKGQKSCCEISWLEEILN